MAYSMSTKLSISTVNKDIVLKFYKVSKAILESYGVDCYVSIIQLKTKNNKNLIMDFRSIEEFYKEVLFEDRILTIIFSFHSRSSSVINNVTFSHFVNEYTLVEIETNQKSITEQLLREIKSGMNDDKNIQYPQNNMITKEIKIESSSGNPDRTSKSTGLPKWLVLTSTIIGILGGLIGIIKFVIFLQ